MTSSMAYISTGSIKNNKIPIVVDVMDARRPKMQENGRDRVIA